MDLTTEWFALVRSLRRQSSTATATTGATEASGAHRRRSGGGGGGGSAVSSVFSSAAEAAVSGSRWRAPLTPFMQQATELNYNIREMHTFLAHHFLDYVDLHHSLPSKRSLMTADEKDLIDLEVTSFMTACAAGVDALKALLQRERLRRMEQEESAARAVGEDGQGLDDVGIGGGGGWGGSGGELRPGSRPAHEHAAVTFLFERLKAVTEVAETMQTERHQRAATSKARFYAGPAETRRDATEKPSSATAGVVWTRTPEELEEERLLRLSFPAAYGSQEEADGAFNDNGDGNDGYDGAETKSATAAAATGPSPHRIFSSNSSSPAVVVAGASLPLPAGGGTSIATGVTGSGGDVSATEEESVDAATAAAASNARRRRDAGQRKQPGVLAGAASAVRRWGSGEAAGGEELGGGSSPVGVPTSVLEGENRDLVARLKNELDDARLVETKMSEISGLMGLFASKVVEQQGGMEHVFDVAVSANDKVVRGGQNLEKAAERGGAFRLFYAYFMISASLCLLFLHFYRS